MTYQPIENYGIIGDLHTVALVGMDGSIDWLCFPHFDSPSVFAAILDHGKGGRFRIAPVAGNSKHKQFYWPDTNVLVTRFLSADGVGEITDYMTVTGSGEGGGHHPHQLCRIVRAIRGEMTFRAECRPAFNYGRDEHSVTISPDGACFHSPGLSLGLAAGVPLVREDGGVVATFSLRVGDAAVFLLEEIVAGVGCGVCLPEPKAGEVFVETVKYSGVRSPTTSGPT